MKIYIGFLLILLVPILEAGITEKEWRSLNREDGRRMAGSFGS